MILKLAIIIPIIALSSGCTRQASSTHMTEVEVLAVKNNVNNFMSTVASEVTKKGPIAWQGFFSNNPDFFMAVNGRIQFKDSDTATEEINKLSRITKHIELKWGDPVRIDPLSPTMAIVAAPYHEVLMDMNGNKAEEDGYFTALAEQKVIGWQFRNAHWSLMTESPVVP